MFAWIYFLNILGYSLISKKIWSKSVLQTIIRRIPEELKNYLLWSCRRTIKVTTGDFPKNKDSLNSWEKTISSKFQRRYAGDNLP